MPALRDQGHPRAPTRERIHADAGLVLWQGSLEQEGSLPFCAVPCYLSRTGSTGPSCSEGRPLVLWLQTYSY